MSDAIREISIRLSLQMVEAKLKMPDMGPAMKSQKDYEKAVSDSEKKLSDLRKREQETVKRQAHEQEQQVHRLAKSQIEAGDKLKAAGEGAFTLARGLALSFTSTDEGLQKMLKNVARVQGFFDIYKGGFEVVKSGVEGMRALSAAGGATTIVMKGLSLATGPVGIGLALAGTAAAALWSLFSSDTPVKRIQATEKATIGLTKQLEFAAKHTKDMVENWRGFSAGGLSRASMTGDLKDVMRAMTDIDNARKAMEPGLERVFRLRARVSQFPKAHGFNRLDENTLQGGVDLQKEIVSLRREELNLSDQKLRHFEQELGRVREIRDVVKDRIKAEADSRLTAQERFGRLVATDPVAAARLASLGRRFQQGNGIRNAEEAQLAEPFFGKQASAFYRKQALEFQGGAAFGDVDLFEEQERKKRIAAAQQGLNIDVFLNANKSLQTADEASIAELQRVVTQLREARKDTIGEITSALAGVVLLEKDLRKVIATRERAEVQNSQ